jgi:hypothetical protein
VMTRLPDELAAAVEEIVQREKAAGDIDASMSRAVADLVAQALNRPKPSTYLNRPKGRRRNQAEVLALELSA